MNDGLGMIIELLVAFLLVLTIGYCMTLNRRLKLLRGDEHALRVTIAELITATEIAERAIGGLKATAHDCEAGLGERLNRAEHLCGELDRRLAAGRHLLGESSYVAAAGAPAEDASLPAHDAHSIAAAAQAVAERLRNKVFGMAA
jgi:Domain of unknown function (DUF6468)